MKQPLQSSSRPSGLIWVNCLHSMVTVGLMRIMEEQAWVHTGRETPEAPLFRHTLRRRRRRPLRELGAPPAAEPGRVDSGLRFALTDLCERR
jgi:hypothetical protein